MKIFSIKLLIAITICYYLLVLANAFQIVWFIAIPSAILTSIWSAVIIDYWLFKVASRKETKDLEKKSKEEEEVMNLLRELDDSE